MGTSQRQPKTEQSKRPSPQRQPLRNNGLKLPVSARELQAALADPQAARPETILQLQRMAGNRAVSGLIQRKVTVGPAHDRYEQEAGRAAKEVVRGQGSVDHPGTETGKQLLAHKLTHTIQQTAGRWVQRALTPSQQNELKRKLGQNKYAKIGQG